MKLNMSKEKMDKCVVISLLFKNGKAMRSSKLFTWKTR